MSKFEIVQHYTGGNMIDNILKRSEIGDKELYLNPTEESLESPYNYKMMAEGVELLYEHMEDDSEIGILVDCDVDGYTSAAIIYKTIQKLQPQRIKVFHHSGKQHGITDEIRVQVIKSGVDILIIPDAGSNDIIPRYVLKSEGIDTLVIDHHEIEDETMTRFEGKYTINNHRDDNVKTNKNLVGAGMALKFIEVLYERYGREYNKECYDLAAIGQIGDMSDLTDPEVRYIVSYGLDNIESQMIKYVISERVQGLKYDIQDDLYSIDIAFNVAPLINAVTRVGEQEEKELLFNCLVEDYDLLEENYRVERRRKINGSFQDVVLNWTPYEYAYDIISNVKNRQDNLVKKIEDDLIDSAKNDNGVAVSILDESEDDISTITGLIANKLASRFEKPVLVLRKRDENPNRYTGSARGYGGSTIEDFKEFISESGYSEFAMGQ